MLARVVGLALLCGLVITGSPVRAATCGNGIVENGESCDDGNRFAGDCCSPTCRVEESHLGCAGECRCDTCEDRLDNDEDGLTDGEDPECATLHRLQRVAFSVGASDALPSNFLAQPRSAAEPASDRRTVASSGPAAVELACVADRPAIEDPGDDDLATCSTARRVASGDADKIATLTGAPVREVQVTAVDPEQILSFDSGTSILALERMALAADSTLRLVGDPDSTVVIQVAGAVVLGAGARVILDGGLRTEHVLWNVSGADGAITLAERAQLAGTLLAPGRAVSLACGATVTGALHAERIEAPGPDCEPHQTDRSDVRALKCA